MPTALARCTCGAPLPSDATRRRVYCSERCRVAAFRARKAAETAIAELRAEAGELEALEPVRAEWPVINPDPEPRPRVHPDEQAARAVLEAQRLAGAFARLGREARPEIAWRCEKLAAALREALADLFPGIS